MALGTLVGKEIKDIQAKVWKLDGGGWAYVYNYGMYVNPDHCGTEPSRLLAIKTVMQNIKEELKNG